MLHVSARWVSQNLSAHDRHWRVASSQELLGSYTSDKELFCCRLVTGDKTWIYHWAPLSKLEFMQWKDVDRPKRICKSAINWLDYGNSFSGIHMDCSWQTICILERQLLVSITQNQHSSYSMSSSWNSDESCQLGVWLFHDNAPAHKSLVAQEARCNCEFVQLNHPAYSLDLAPSNYFLIRNLKYRLRGTWDRLRNDLYCVGWGVKLYSNQIVEPELYTINHWRWLWRHGQRVNTENTIFRA